MELPVLGERDVPRGTVRFDERSMRDAGVAPGDRVTVRGDDRTVAGVGDPHGEGTGVVAAPDVLDAAGLAVGDAALVASPSAPPATSVTLAPPGGFRFEGVTDALVDPLRGRTVVAGDEVHPELFGGSLQVRFVVADVEPSEPAVVTPSTEVVVGDSPAGPAGSMGGRDRTFDDVGGLDDAVTSVRRLVQFPLEQPDTYRELAGGAPGGVLLTGPPGSGKTLLADAVGTETDARYLRVPHLDAVDRRYDDGFESLAAEAVRSAPTVVLLDDVHELAPGGDPGATGGRPAAVGAFLDAVADEQVVVVGTTASPESVAPSLRRGGRFDHEVEVGVPDRDGRLAVLRTQVAEVPLSSDVDLATVADRTHGFVGADLRALVRAAVRNAVDRAVDDGAAELRAADFESALSRVAPSGLRGLRIERPDVTYDDVGGLDDAKLEVVRAVEWPLTHPELLDRVATAAPTGVLLHGLPGTGKTMLARAVANATDANFLAVQGPELLDRYVGESERGVREVFERAARNAPSVVFFDEIDALAPERGGDSDTDVTERVVSQLLTELDGVEPREGVVVIGATNRPDVVDPALLRPGRLERVVEVPMPDRDAREEIFRTHAAEVPTGEVDFARLAARTDGYTGSDIEAVVREAGLLAVEDHLRDRGGDERAVDPAAVGVRHSHFERALASVSPSVSAEMRQRYADLVEDMPQS